MQPFVAFEVPSVLPNAARIVHPWSMSCEHTGPPEVMELAERWLLDRGVDRQRWQGMRIRHGENTPGTMWESVLIEIERRGSEWWVTQLDRRKQPLPESDLGLRIAE